MGDAEYDSSLFRIMIEETVSTITFPVFEMDISDAMNGIAGKFNGELVSAREKTELSTALSRAISRIYDELCNQLETRVADFKKKMSTTGQKVEESLLTNIISEFETLSDQCTNKEKEIADYKAYAVLLQSELDKIK